LPAWGESSNDWDAARRSNDSAHLRQFDAPRQSIARVRKWLTRRRTRACFTRGDNMPSSKPAQPRRKPDAVKTLIVVVETPRGSRNKYKYEPRLERFRLKSVLPAGADFPYDFGFIPKTRGSDGDPLDILVLMDEPTFPGCLVEVRLIGVFEAQQTEEGQTVRNDRIVGVAVEAHNYRSVRKLADIETNLRKELEQFLTTYGRLQGKKVSILARRGPKAAWRLVKRGRRKRE
jgi:inorganic pyrophosphatase